MKNLFIKTKYDADEKGFFGPYGGRYVPEMLLPELIKLEKAYLEAKNDPQFAKELSYLFETYSGRPTPLYFAENMTRNLGGAKIYLKFEGLNHTGAHKLNHCLGQALIAKRMGKKVIIAETGAGQHGVATATVAAKLGMECRVYMGSIDVERQRPNVFWMEQLGAKVIPVDYGTKRLKDAVMGALQDWIQNPTEVYYLLGSAVGPHPYPSMVKDFQTIVGLETKEQIAKAESRNPDYVISSVGGGSNSIGIFNAFLDDDAVQMIGVEGGGKGTDHPNEHASRIQGHARPGIIEGYKSLFLMDEDGQVSRTHSISAGLDYSGIGPQHAHLSEIGRVKYSSRKDTEVLSAFQMLARQEGIFAALESSHAIAEAIALAPTLSKDKIIVANISGRGDKDIFILARAFGDASWKEFLKSQIEN